MITDLREEERVNKFVVGVVVILRDYALVSDQHVPLAPISAAPKTV